jgi:hypothetical protein
MKLFHCLRFETPPTWRARSQYLYHPGTGWPDYTPRHCVLVSSSSKTRRATLEVFEPASTRGSTPHDSVKIQGQNYFTTGGLPPINSSLFDTDSVRTHSVHHREHRFPQFLYCCVNNCCYADVAFRAPLLLHWLLFRNFATDVCPS